MENENKIYVVGDSHSLFWGGWNGIAQNYQPQVENKHFVILSLGPVLAYSLNKYNTTAKGREKFDNLYKESRFTPPPA